MSPVWSRRCLGRGLTSRLGRLAEGHIDVATADWFLFALRGHVDVDDVRVVVAAAADRHVHVTRIGAAAETRCGATDAGVRIFGHIDSRVGSWVRSVGSACVVAVERKE